MCGFTGYFAVDHSFNPEKFVQANDLIAYRGPDDVGYVSVDSQCHVQEVKSGSATSSLAEHATTGAMGFRRLAIIDLSEAGHQPMCDVNRRYWIVFNGEVYNYVELRAELKSLGYNFRSDSDTEVVLAAYIQWGQECLHKFNGMWSLSILDTVSQTVFCARDRFGIKPFNYYFDDTRFVFGSEVKQIRHMIGDTGKDYTTLLDFTLFGAKNFTEHTCYLGIKELRGGECIEVDLSNKQKISLKQRTWWDLTPHRFEGSEDSAIEKLLDLLRDSVRIRLRSDVGTGTALSGGLDSTGLVALIDEVSTGRQNVFTVVSRDKNLDELAYANQTIDKYKLNSFKAEFGKQSVEELERVSFHHDQPVDSASIFGGWILQKLVKESGVVVNLNGQGADELMGGYSRPPHALRYLDAISNFELIDAHRELAAGFSRADYSMLTSGKIFAADVSRYMIRGHAYKAVMRSRGAMLNSEAVDSHANNSRFLSGPPRLQGLKSLQKQQAYGELKSLSLPALLHNADRDSMAHSVEARVPFLDYRVAEHLFSLSPGMLTRKGYTKYIYRKSMEGRIPNQILWDNNKKGFTTPANDYLALGRDYFNDLLSDSANHPMIDVKKLKQLTPKSREYGSAVHWRLLCTLIWERAHTYSPVKQ